MCVCVRESVCVSVCVCVYVCAYVCVCVCVSVFEDIGGGKDKKIGLWQVLVCCITSYAK